MGRRGLSVSMRRMSVCGESGGRWTASSLRCHDGGAAGRASKSKAGRGRWARWWGQTDKKVIVSCAGHGCGRAGWVLEGAWRAAGASSSARWSVRELGGFVFGGAAGGRERAGLRGLSRSQSSAECGGWREMLVDWLAILVGCSLLGGFTQSQIAAWGRTTGPDLHPHTARQDDRDSCPRAADCLPPPTLAQKSCRPDVAVPETRCGWRAHKCRRADRSSTGPRRPRSGLFPAPPMLMRLAPTQLLFIPTLLCMS